MIDLHVKLCLTIFWGWRSTGQRSNKEICCLAYDYLLKTHRTLKLSGLVCLNMLLQCTNYERSMSRDSGSKIKRPKSVAKIAQPKAFEPLMLEA